MSHTISRGETRPRQGPLRCRRSQLTDTQLVTMVLRLGACSRMPRFWFRRRTPLRRFSGCEEAAVLVGIR